MRYRSIYILLILVLLMGVLDSVKAQGVAQYLADKAMAVAHLTVSVEGQAPVPKTWWRSVWSYLGVRTMRIRPEIGTTITVNSSAYASSPYQTDATPCVTAAGTTVRPGVVATNFLPLGTIVSIDGKRYIVEDRMNSRYDGYYMDIWFASTSEALEFGRKKLPITIVEYAEPGADIAEPTPEPEGTEEERGFWQTVGDSVTAIGRFLVTRTYTDVNRHDIDCNEVGG